MGAIPRARKGWETEGSPPSRRRVQRSTRYLVVWWMSKAPYAAVFENRIAAEAAARVRNALMIEVSGGDVNVDEVLDWYRRDDAGEPMRAEWRELVGAPGGPWARVASEAAEALA